MVFQIKCFFREVMIDVENKRRAFERFALSLVAGAGMRGGRAGVPVKSNPHAIFAGSCFCLYLQPHGFIPGCQKNSANTGDSLGNAVADKFICRTVSDNAAYF